MTTLKTTQTAQITLITPPGMPSLYVEGLSQIMVGFPNSRMLLHSFSDRDVRTPNAPESRKMGCELIMPTSSMIEIAQLIINSLVDNKDALEAHKTEWLGKLELITNSLKHIDSPVMQSQPASN